MFCIDKQGKKEEGQMKTRCRFLVRQLDLVCFYVRSLPPVNSFFFFFNCFA